ncbi:MAG: sigma-70 family RNA polymerase sigma factor [Gemmiger sp.]
MLGILGIFLQAAAGHILYLALHLESGSFPRPLPPAEEQAAFAAMAAGDKAARDTLIRHNLRLVAHVAKKYYASPDGQDDLISIGTIGLIKAVDSFDSRRRVRFASYASQCIENEIRMHLRRVRREAGTVSLQEPLEGDSGLLTLADTLPDDTVMEDDCERRDAIRRLRTLVRALPERDRQLLSLRYGLQGSPPLTQQEVADRFGISRSYVSRLEKRALAALAARWHRQ